jgi:hypothetical protein
MAKAKKLAAGEKFQKELNETGKKRKDLKWLGKALALQMEKQGTMAAN